MNQIRLHLTLTLLWCALVIPTVLLWRDSIAWVSFMSIYAIVASHWACWEAAKAKQSADLAKESP